jgi:SAM-dependent methyltransferase
MELAEYRRMHDLEERHWWFRAKRRMVFALLERWGNGGGRALDVGCGTGITLLELPPRFRALGLDPAAEAVALCRERGLSDLVRGSATEIPLPGGAADVVLALDIVEHVEDDVAALREIARVLSPSGIAVLTVPAFPFLWSAHDEALHHKRRYTRRVFEQRLSQAGLAVRVGGFSHATIFPLAAVLRLVRRPASGRNGSAASDVREAPRWLDGLAYRVLAWEVPFICRGLLPVGLSLAYVVTRGHPPAQANGRAGAGARA